MSRRSRAAPGGPTRSQDYHEAVLEFNIERDQLHQEIVALEEGTEAKIRATGATISRIRQRLHGKRPLPDGESTTEVERLQRRVAELEALLAEKEG